jgi:hypothetical protein
MFMLELNHGRLLRQVRTKSQLLVLLVLVALKHRALVQLSEPQLR